MHRKHKKFPIPEPFDLSYSDVEVEVKNDAAPDMPFIKKDTVCNNTPQVICKNGKYNPKELTDSIKNGIPLPDTSLALNDSQTNASMHSAHSKLAGEFKQANRFGDISDLVNTQPTLEE